MYREINKSDCPRIEYKKIAGESYDYKVEIDAELPGLWRYQFKNGLVIIVSEKNNSGVFEVSYWRNEIPTQELLAPQPKKIISWFKEFFIRVRIVTLIQEAKGTCCKQAPTLEWSR